MFRAVPVLPVVIPVAAAVLVALLWSLHRRGRFSVPRAAVALALCIYAAGIIANTVFPIYLDKPSHGSLWKVYFTSLSDYEVVDAAMNVLVFVPVGILVPLLLSRATWWRVLLAGAAFSLVIELTQLVTGNLLGGGHVADVNDLLFNVTGAVVGLVVFTALSRVPPLARLIDLFRWR